MQTQTIQQAREHVARLAREIEKLADAGGPPDEFFPAFLSRLVSVLGAMAGAVWLKDSQNRISLASELNLQSTGFYVDAESRKRNDRILSHVLETGEASVQSADGEGEFETPTAHVLLLASLQKQRQTVGVVEIFQRADAPRDARPGYLQFMEQMCGHASRYLQLRDAAETEASPVEFWKQLERFVLQLQRSLSSNEIAAVGANDARRLLQCDRVSIAVRRGGRTRVTAMSGAESVNRRANLVRLMERMTERVIAAREPLLYTGATEELAPQIVEPLAAYIEESQTRLVHIVPLVESSPLVGPGGEERRRRSRGKPERKVIGAVIVEQVTESRPKPGLEERTALVADHVGAALSQSLAHEGLFLLPLWRTLGEWTEGLRGRTLYKVLAVLGAVLIAAVTLVVVPWEYRVEGKGRLMPVVQREVFATWDGEVTDVLVESGERVEAGQPLLKLRNEDLQSKLLAARNELSEKEQLLFALQAQADQMIRAANRNEEIEVEGKVVQTRIEIEGAKEQVKLYQDQVGLLTIRSPIAGIVATFQVGQLLKNRPVQRGEVLLEVMDDTGRWHLELEVPEDRMGHVLRRQQALQTERLAVEFVVATTSEESYQGVLTRSSTRAALAEEEGSVVEVFADLAEGEMPRLTSQLRIGADVRAKISCGKKPLGYVLFGDVIEFVQRRLLLW